MLTSDALDKEHSQKTSSSSTVEQEEEEHTWHTDLDAEHEQSMLFCPYIGNVVFSSAVDGWAFGLGDFSCVYASKFEVSPRQMRRALWGEYYFNQKTKKILQKPPHSSSLPLFVQCVLTPIWSVYSASQLDPNPERVTQILKSLRIYKDLSQRDLKHSDRRIATQSIMKRWLPLSNAMLRMAVRILPNPIDAQRNRCERLWPDDTSTSSTLDQVETIKQSISCCNSASSAPIVAFISKMVSVHHSLLSDTAKLGSFQEEKEEEIFVAFARIYSGTLSNRKEDENDQDVVYVLGPKFNSSTMGEHRDLVHRKDLKFYMMMGRELTLIDSVPAGNVFGIVGLGDIVLKTATLTSSLACPYLTKLPYQMQPIVRVAIEPEDPRHFAQMEKGLQLLYRADPTVEVLVQESGEHVIVGLGELHLERCIKDLMQRFAKVPIRASPPLVGFRETIILGDISNAQQSIFLKHQQQKEAVAKKASCITTSISTADGSIVLELRALPLPDPVTDWIEAHVDDIRLWINTKDEANGCNLALGTSLKTSLAACIALFLSEDWQENEEESNTTSTDETSSSSSSMVKRKKEYGMFWQKLSLESIWSLGPRRIGSNVLICNLKSWLPKDRFFSCQKEQQQQQEEHVFWDKIANSLVTGFQMATCAGPLCGEPVSGVAFIVENIHQQDVQEEEEEDQQQQHSYGPLSGQLISSMKTGCIQAFLHEPVRLVEAMYQCTIQCHAEQLGKCYGVLSKRRGQILKEGLTDGTSLFTIEAYVPVMDSFGFASDLLSQTSGCASTPQLWFSHWQRLSLDPYFQPNTEEEREKYGETIDSSDANTKNRVRKVIDTIRRRKGLQVEEKLVVHAEKQRTLTRNK